MRNATAFKAAEEWAAKNGVATVQALDAVADATLARAAWPDTAGKPPPGEHLTAALLRRGLCVLLAELVQQRQARDLLKALEKAKYAATVEIAVDGVLVAYVEP